MKYLGYEITTDTLTNSDTLLDFIQDQALTGEDVFNIFVGWHGTQLCTAELLENLLMVECGMEPDEQE